MPLRVRYPASVLRPGGGIGTFAAVRWLIIYALARIVVIRRLSRRRGRRRSTEIEAPTVFEPFSAPPVVERLRDDGIDATLRLPASITERLAAAAARIAMPVAHPCAEGPGDPEIDAMASDATLLEIAAGYLGRSPEYTGCRVWWLDEKSVVEPLSSGTRYHYDLYDYAAVAFLVFLTDVVDEAGSHCCVRGSQRRRPWRDQIRPTRHRSEAEVIAAYGAHRIVTVTGPAGTVIAEDPFCFHRARPPKGGRRLALQFLYTARDFPVPSFRRITTVAGGPRAPGRDSEASRREIRRIVST
jgi:hypothetical protein